MIKVSIFYPNLPSRRFDMDYYLNQHIPLSIELFSAHSSFRGVSVERGLGGGAPDAPPTYVVICQFLFETFDGFMEAFGPNRAVLQGDMPNYTDIETIVQISEVALVR